MNYIRINNDFINLRQALHIRVLQPSNAEIAIQITYPGRVETIHLDTHVNEIDSSYPVLTRDAIAGSIQDAIANCCDADCENVAEYVEDNLDEDDDY